MSRYILYNILITCKVKSTVIFLLFCEDEKCLYLCAKAYLCVTLDFRDKLQYGAKSTPVLGFYSTRFAPKRPSIAASKNTQVFFVLMSFIVDNKIVSCWCTGR